ncbi:MAG: MarR family transcriptional regulator [Candidatus ainarchaeum sp.]|jgi:uncharacterized membrane protein|nr:MarR family transcriptional regulator [Candidatus ainarchaeum sp.]
MELVKENIVFILINLILLISFVNAEEYYANLNLELLKEGSLIINGATNHSFFESKITQELTQKEGKNWTLNINTEDIFSEYTYKLILPPETKIQEIQTTSTYYIQTENERLIIEGYGENTPFKILLTYTQNQTQPAPTNQINTILGIILITILLIIGIVILIKLKKSKNNLTEEFDSHILTERQLKIIIELENNKNYYTQTNLQKKLLIPKASLFRNLQGLEKKGIIKRERKGMTMLITLIKKRK